MEEKPGVMEAYGPGLYEVKYQMPCLPKDFRVHKYYMEDLHEDSRASEAAARLLSYSAPEKWLAVTANRLTADMRADLSRWSRVQTQMRCDQIREQLAKMDRTQYIWNCVKSLGLHALNHDLPSTGRVHRPTLKLPDSQIYKHDPTVIWGGLMTLFVHGLIDVVYQMEERIFIPTPNLAQRVLSAQVKVRE